MILNPSDPSFLPRQFCCPECGAHEAYYSRPRGIFEKYLLPAMFLRPVRCDRCYRRSYVLRSVSALERKQPLRKQPQSEHSVNSHSSSSIA